MIENNRDIGFYGNQINEGEILIFQSTVEEEWDLLMYYLDNGT